MSETNHAGCAGPGLPTLIFLVFLTLKLAGIGVVAGWSWWKVTSPLWIATGLWVGVAFLILIGGLAAAAAGRR